MFCPNCGREIRKGQKFCTGCGAMLTPPSNTGPQPQAGNAPHRPAAPQTGSSPQPASSGKGLPSNKKFLIILAAVLAVIVIAALAFFLTGGSHGEKQEGSGTEADRGDEKEGDTGTEDGYGDEKDEGAETEDGRGDEKSDAENAGGSDPADGPAFPAVSADYGTICQEMRSLATASVSAQQLELMESMLSPVTNFSLYSLTAPWKQSMAELPEEKAQHLGSSIIQDFPCSSYGLDSTPNNDYGYNYDKGALDAFMKDYFGGSAQNWGQNTEISSEWKVVDDQTLSLTYGDGDPWIYGENPEVRENSEYYLVSMPCFYGDNGGVDHLFQYYLDALFVKNPDSRFGLTLCYTESALQASSGQNAQAAGSSGVQGDTWYVVNCDEWISLRSSPSTQASTLTQIPLYSRVTYLAPEANGFCKIQYNGHTGYALADYLTSYEPYVTGWPYRVINAKQSITLRTQPSTSGAEILQIPVGSDVTVYKYTSTEFYLVEYNGMYGYAMASYLGAR